MRDWIAGAMTVLGTLLVLSGAAVIVLRAWDSTKPAKPAEPAGAPVTVPGTTFGTSATTSAPTPTERLTGARGRVGPAERLILWGTLLLVLAAITAGAIGFELGASATAK
jgi:hypothetical protein